MNHAGKAPPPAPGDGSVDLWGHHIALTTQYAVLAVLILAAGYFLLFPRVRHVLRRLGICAAIAAAGSAVYVGWHDHAHHAQLVQAAAAPGADPVPKSLLWGWAGFALGGTVALFLASGWWLRQRAQGRFQFTWLRRFGRRRGGAGSAYPPPGAGRPAGRVPGGRPPGRLPQGFPGGYEADDPYGGLPPGFPPGFGGRR